MKYSTVFLTVLLLLLAQTRFLTAIPDDATRNVTTRITNAPLKNGAGDPLDNLEFTYDDPYEVVWPAEYWIKRPVFVRNKGTTDLNIQGRMKVVETGDEISGFPQPFNLYLAPGENQTIWVVLGASHLGLTSQDLEKENTYTRTIRLTVSLQTIPMPLDGGDGSVRNIYLKHVIAVKPITWTENHPNAVIYGTVYDKATGKPLNDTKVEFRGVPMGRTPYTDKSGYYEVRFYAHTNVENKRVCPYVLWIERSGYEAFIKPFWPVSGDNIKQDVYLEKTREKVTATLMKRVETNMTIYRGAVSKDERFVVFSQGHHEINISDEEAASVASVLLFDTNGTMLWKYTPGCGEIWGVDISDDGSYVAAAVWGLEQYNGFAKAILLDHSGKLVWDTSRLGSIGTAEIKFSHSGKYVAWGTGPGTLYLFNRTNGEIVWTRFVEGQIRQILFSADDSRVYAGSGDGYLYTIRADNGQVLSRTYIEAWPYSTGGMRLSRDGKYIATGSKIGNITLANATSGRRLWTFDTIGGANSIDISPNNDFVIAGSGGAVPLSLFDISGNLRWWKPVDAKSVMIAPDGKHIVVGRDWGVEVMNTNGTVVWSHLEDFTYIHNPVETHFVYINRNQTRLITGHGGGAVYFWNISIRPTSAQPSALTLPPEYIAYIGGAVLVVIAAVVIVRSRKRHVHSRDLPQAPR